MTRATVAILFVAVTGLLVALVSAADRPASVTLSFPDGSTAVYVPQQSAPQPATLPATVPPVVTPRTRPAPDPQPATQPVLWFHRVARPEDDNRDYGWRAKPGAATLRDTYLQGFNANISIEALGDEPALIENVMSVRAWRMNAGNADRILHGGQCLYAGNGTRTLIVRGYYASEGGWWDGQPIRDRNTYRHTLYADFGVRLVIEDSWLDRAACAGIQMRGGGDVTRCLLTKSAYAVLVVMGDVRIKDCVVYDGWTIWSPPDADRGKPATMAGNTAIQAYWPTTVTDTWVVGHPDQGKGVGVPAGMKVSNLGAVNGSRKYTGKPEWRASPLDVEGRPAPRITATRSFVVGWPGEAFVGDAKPSADGWTVGGRPVDVWPQLDAIRADMLAGRVTIVEAVARGRAAVIAEAAKTLQ